MALAPVPGGVSIPAKTSSSCIPFEELSRKNPRFLKQLRTLCEKCQLEVVLSVMEQRNLCLCTSYAYSFLQQCTKIKDLNCAVRLHLLMVHSQLDSVAFFSDHFIRLFTSMGSSFEANRMFQCTMDPTIYTWYSIISAHVNFEESRTALGLYHRMGKSVIKACTMTLELEQGRIIHGQIVESGLQFDPFLGSAILSMYIQCGSLEEAKRVFEKLQKSCFMSQNTGLSETVEYGGPSFNQAEVIYWNTMISGYTQYGECFLSFQCYNEMHKRGIKPNKITFLCLLKTCIKTKCLEYGRQTHQQLIQYRQHFDLVLGSGLVDMYVKCESLEEAFGVFNKFSNADVVLWNVMIGGCVEHGDSFLALDCFDNMKHEGTNPNKVTLLFILKACGSIGAIEQGRFIHNEVIGYALHSDAVVGSALIDMYVKCYSLEEACEVFETLARQDVVSWGAMIAGYVQHGRCFLALHYFKQMQEEGIEPDKVAFLSGLKACGSIGAIGQGKFVHNQILRTGLQFDNVLGNTVMDMYVKCGCFEDACEVFERLQYQDVVSWGILIAGFVHFDKAPLALECFRKMGTRDVKPDNIIFLGMLKVCGIIGSVDYGIFMHEQLMKSGIHSDVFLENTMIDMYAKCGNMGAAREIFNKMSCRNMVSWNAMVAGYAQHNDVILAMQFVEDMEQSGIQPDKVAFLGILMACSHVGLVEEGCWYFRYMQERHHVMPDIMHHNCVVDLLGRAGCFKEAVNFLQATVEPSISHWHSLLSACKLHGNMDLAKVCFIEAIS